MLGRHRTTWTTGRYCNTPPAETTRTYLRTEVVEKTQKSQKCQKRQENRHKRSHVEKFALHMTGPLNKKIKITLLPKINLQG